jgi:hypothetical protein
LIDSETVTAPAREWDPPPDPAPRAAVRTAVALLFLVIPGAFGALGVVSSSPALWALAAVALVLEGAWVAAQGARTRGRVRQASEERDARALNIANGLSSDLGMVAPRVVVAQRTGANAAVLPRGTVLLTEDLVNSYSRTELEAVIAHCLVRLREGGLRWALAVAALGGLGRSAAPFVGQSIDARTAALTRYPPALAAAIEKATPATGSSAGLWFSGDDASHLPPAERVAALLDL